MEASCFWENRQHKMWCRFPGTGAEQTQYFEQKSDFGVYKDHKMWYDDQALARSRCVERFPVVP